LHQRGNQANSKHIDGIKAAGEITASCSIGNRGRFCIVLKSSRFFRGGSRPGGREGYADDKSKVTEYLYRRVDLEDVVAAHLRPSNVRRRRSFDRCIISAATPFLPAICGLAPRCPAGGVPSCPRLRDGPCALRLGHGFQD